MEEELLNEEKDSLNLYPLSSNFNVDNEKKITSSYASFTPIEEEKVVLSCERQLPHSADVLSRDGNISKLDAQVERTTDANVSFQQTSPHISFPSPKITLQKKSTIEYRLSSLPTEIKNVDQQTDKEFESNIKKSSSSEIIPERESEEDIFDTQNKNQAKMLNKRIKELEAENTMLKEKNSKMAKTISLLEEKLLNIGEELSKIEKSTKKATEELKANFAKTWKTGKIILDEKHSLPSKRALDSPDPQSGFVDENQIGNKVIFIEGIVQTLEQLQEVASVAKNDCLVISLKNKKKMVYVKEITNLKKEVAEKQNKIIEYQKLLRSSMECFVQIIDSGKLIK